MPRKSEQEWAIIEDDYIRNPVIYQNLEDKYNVSAQSICARSQKRDWDGKRTKYIDRMLNNGLKNNQDEDIKYRKKEEKSILSQIEELIKLKTKAELLAFTTYLTKAEQSKALSPIEIMQLINKSKDGITELTKLAELLKGNATDRLDFQEQDAESRNTRLNVLGFVSN